MADNKKPDKSVFPKRGSKELVETKLTFMPKFDQFGLIPAIATDAATGEVLMFAFMNEAALAETINTGRAVYWSRSRKEIWRKGETSGNIQRVIELRTGCDQDVIWIKVEMEGHDAACHIGYRSCFHRAVPPGTKAGPDMDMVRTEDAPSFDADEVYGKNS